MLFTKEVKECHTPGELAQVGISLLDEGETLKHDRTIRNRNKKRKHVNTQLELAVSRAARFAIDPTKDDAEKEEWSKVGEYMKKQIEAINNVADKVQLNLDWI